MKYLFWILAAILIYIPVISAADNGTITKQKGTDGSDIYTGVGTKDETQNTSSQSFNPQLILTPSPAPARSVESTQTIPYKTVGSLIQIEALINDRVKARLAVDTGATITALSRTITDQLEITSDQLQGPFPGFGANGLFVARYVRIQSLTVGALQERTMDVMVLPTEIEGIDGLLGQDFLSIFLLTINPVKSELTFTPIGMGEVLYNDKPGIWWCRQFERLQQIIDFWKQVAAIPLTTEKPGWTTSIEAIINRTQKQREDLWTQAAQYALPMEFRNAPCVKETKE